MKTKNKKQKNKYNNNYRLTSEHNTEIILIVKKFFQTPPTILAHHFFIVSNTKVPATQYFHLHISSTIEVNKNKGTDGGGGVRKTYKFWRGIKSSRFTGLFFSFISLVS